MSKIINLKPYKTVTVALFIFMLLLLGSTAWVQSGNPSPYVASLDAMDPSGWPVVVGVTCEIYVATETPNTLKTIKSPHVPITHWVLPALDIPPTKTSVTYTLTKAHINGYWDLIYKKSNGWDRGGRTATTGYNCHGHSTGREKWMSLMTALENRSTIQQKSGLVKKQTRQFLSGSKTPPTIFYKEVFTPIVPHDTIPLIGQGRDRTADTRIFSPTTTTCGRFRFRYGKHGLTAVKHRILRR